MRSKRLVAITITAVFSAGVSCNRDPNVAKRRYLESRKQVLSTRASSKKPALCTSTPRPRTSVGGRRTTRLGLTALKLGSVNEAGQRVCRAVELLPCQRGRGDEEGEPADSIRDHWDVRRQAVRDLSRGNARDGTQLEQAPTWSKLGTFAKIS